MHPYRTHTCAALTPADVGNTVRLSGWVHRVRDHGGLLFIDLRDHYGLTQLVIDPESAAFDLSSSVRSEWVIRVDGEVKARAAEAVNPKMATGGIEVFIRELEVLSEAQELPLPVFGEPDYPEEIRLKYRFLDLRRETLHANLVNRTKVIASMRRRMTDL
ncbi:MAG: OB-fold nucleic acid binding domain-containing protein, partial [Devosia sp.]|nr:OB-fold nucleic acid binding domain-containing protein [Devosia sp.]